MTITHAKELSRQTIGRLPKCGHEVCIEHGYRQLTLTNEWDGKKVFGRFEYRIYLANESGRYRVWEWNSVNPATDQPHVQS
jgi:hypothetical protein